MMAREIRRAIRTIESSRDTHLAWLRHYTKYPGEEKRHARLAGSRVHHRRCVDRYGQVLRVLREALARTSRARRPSRQA